MRHRPALLTTAVAVAAVTASTLAAPTSYADPGSGTATFVSVADRHAYSEQPSLAVAADGTQHVAYRDESLDPLQEDAQVVLASRTAGSATWTHRVVQAGGGPQNINVYDPAVAVAPNGDVVVVWLRFKYSDDELHADRAQLWCRTFPADPLDPGDVALVSSEFDYAGAPGIGIGPSGDVAIAFARDLEAPAPGGGTTYANTSSLSLRQAPVDEVCGGGAVTLAPTHDGVDRAVPPAVGVSADGTATVAWTEHEDGQGAHVFVQRLGDSELARARLTIPESTSASQVHDVAVRSNTDVGMLVGSGDDLAAFTLEDGAWVGHGLDGDGVAGGGAIAVLPGGRYVAVSSVDGEVKADRLGAGTDIWSGLRTLTSVALPTLPGISVTPEGDVTVAWTRTLDEGGEALETRTLPAGSTWSTSAFTPAASTPVGTGTYWVIGTHQPVDRTTFVWHEGGDARLASSDVGGTAPPAGDPPVATLPVLPKVQKTNRIRLAWTLTDNDFGTTSEVRVRQAPITGTLGGWRTLAPVAGREKTVQVAYGTHACFSVRATDGDGVGPWSATRCTIAPLDDAQFAKSKGARKWKGKAGSGHAYDSWSETRAQGATITVPKVRGVEIGILADTGAGFGTVKVSLGGTVLRTVKLAGPAAKGKVFSLKSFGSARSGKLVITVVSKGKVVRIDGVWARSA